MFHNNADAHISSLAYLCYYILGRWGYLSDIRPDHSRLIPQGAEEFFVRVSEAKILPSRSYESPVFTVKSKIKPSVIIKFNYSILCALC